MASTDLAAIEDEQVLADMVSADSLFLVRSLECVRILNGQRIPPGGKVLAKLSSSVRSSSCGRLHSVQGSGVHPRGRAGRGDGPDSDTQITPCLSSASVECNGDPVVGQGSNAALRPPLSP